MRLPLSGRRIVVTRSAEQADELAARLEALGAEAIVFPVIRFVPLPSDALDVAVANLGRYDWLIFTSGNTVRFFCEAYRPRERQLRLPPIAASGSATAERLQEAGIQPAFIPEEFVGERLVEGLGDLRGKRVLLPRSRAGRPEIAAMLRERGAIVDDIALYDTLPAEPAGGEWASLAEPVDVVTFTSPSSVRNWAALLERAPERPAGVGPVTLAACIGPVTAEACEKAGLRADIVPGTYTIDGLVAAIAARLAGEGDHAD